MASGGPVKQLCEELTCPVCLDYLQDPVTITECGHNFCRGCLTQCWGESEDKAFCPLCKETAQPRNLRPNRQLANIVAIAKELSRREEKAPDPKRVKGEERLCEKHQEPLKLFCQQDQIFICVVCHTSKEHRSHEVVPLEEASQEYRDVRSTLKRYEEKQKSGDLVAFPPELKKMIWGVHGINDVLEDHRKQFKDSLASGPQVQKDSLASGLQVQKDSLVAGPQVKKDSLASALHLQKATVNVTLDPDTAHPRLVLSEDRKNVKWQRECQELPNNPERFDIRHCAMGCEEFTAGQHFWEVIVGGEIGWAVGVARKSVKRKGWIRLTPEEGIWAVGRWKDGYFVYKQFHSVRLSLSEKPKKILVSLDYEGGQVTFLDTDRATVLYQFSGATFSGQTLRPFFNVHLNAQLRLSP